MIDKTEKLQKANSNKRKRDNNKDNSSSNDSQLSDENKNSLNNSVNKSVKSNSNKDENNTNQKEMKLEKLQKLTYLFPFIKDQQHDINNVQKEKDYSISEYNKMVTNILKNNLNPEKNKSLDYLDGKINIIDKVIQNHIPETNDSQVMQITPNITSIKMTIDKDFNMMNDIGFRLPNLIELNLENSKIESISDIGASFAKLEKLNVSNCELVDLSGIICFKNLKELIAKKNHISDLIDLEMCDQIKFIDLSYNDIEDEDTLFFLNSCPKLEKVILTGNKIKSINKNNFPNIQIVL